MEYFFDLNISKTCRICLSQNEELCSLFTKHIVDGYVRTMPEIIDSCLGIEVQESDPLPTQICKKCKSTLLNYYTFKEKCLRTEKVLRNTFAKQYHDDIKLKEQSQTQSLRIFEAGQEIQQCQKVEQEDIEDQEDHTIASIVPLDNQDEASKMTSDYSSVIGEKDEDTNIEEMYKNSDLAENIQENSKEFEYPASLDQDSEEPEFFCIFCEKVFLGKNYFEHCRKSHYLCLDCLDAFEHIEDLKEHTASTHFDEQFQMRSDETYEDDSEENFDEKSECSKPSKNTLLCEFCQKRMGSREQYNNHMQLHKSLHLITDKLECFTCEECHVIFLKSDDLQTHTLMHKNTDDITYMDYQFLEESVCGICNARYSNVTDLKYHIILHSDKFSCPFEACGCEYETFSRLSVHINKKHINGVEHLCTHCKKIKFPTFDELQEHIRNDCSAKKFACNHCEKKFFSNKALQLHLKNINGKKYVCQFCGKSFAQQGELTIHNRTHTGERPFKCTICEKTYKTASMRAAHMDAHIDGKTFSCTLCGKKLQTRTSYRNHMKRHTEEKKFSCEVCSKKFFTRYHLKLHFMKMHNK